MLVLIVVLSCVAVQHVSSVQPMTGQELVMHMTHVSDCNAVDHPSSNDLDIIFLNMGSAIENATHEGKCFLGCLMEKSGFIKDGKILRSNIEEQIKARLQEKDLASALKYLDLCEKELVGVSPDKCVNGPVLMGCIRKYDAAMRGPH